MSKGRMVARRRFSSLSRAQAYIGCVIKEHGCRYALFPSICHSQNSIRRKDETGARNTLHAAHVWCAMGDCDVDRAFAGSRPISNAPLRSSGLGYEESRGKTRHTHCVGDRMATIWFASAEEALGECSAAGGCRRKSRTGCQSLLAEKRMVC